MTAITTTADVPTVGGDADTWGGKLNAKWATAYADLNMLNTATANSILGRNEAEPGEVERLTGTEVTAMLDAVEGDAGSGGTKGLVPAPAAGAAASGQALLAGGAFGNPGAAHGAFLGSDGSPVGTAKNLTCVAGGGGTYAFTFGTALASANYMVLVTCYISTGFLVYSGTLTAKTASGFSVMVTTVDETPVGTDPTELYVQVVMLA